MRPLNLDLELDPCIRLGMADERPRVGERPPDAVASITLESTGSSWGAFLKETDLTAVAVWASLLAADVNARELERLRRVPLPPPRGLLPRAVGFLWRASDGVHGAADAIDELADAIAAGGHRLADVVGWLGERCGR